MPKDKKKVNKESDKETACANEQCDCGENCGCGCEYDCECENAECEGKCAGEQPEVSEMKDKFLRLAADFENYKKRAKAERETLYQFSVAETVEKFLPVIDDMERALAAAEEDSPLKKGVEQIVLKFASILDTLGVKTIGEEGEAFDVSIHEAIMQGESEEGEGKVLQVFQKGYSIGNKVVRYAKVKVSV